MFSILAPARSPGLYLGLWLAVTALAASPEDIRIMRDVPYLAANRSEKLDLYLPASSSRPAPAVVWIHGRRGDKGEPRGTEICQTLAQAGYVCVSINHGPDPELRSNLLDCKNAVRFLRHHAREYNLAPERIAVMGGSMGAYYALLVGFTAGRPELEPDAPYPGSTSHVRAVVDFYGPLGPPFQQVTTFVAAGGPPVLILHGDDDQSVPVGMSVELARALGAAGVEHQLVRLPGIGHTFRLKSTWDNQPLPHDLTPILLAFLERHLGSGAIPPVKSAGIR